MKDTFISSHFWTNAEKNIPSTVNVCRQMLPVRRQQIKMQFSYLSDSNPYSGVELRPWTFQWDLTLRGPNLFFKKRYDLEAPPQVGQVKVNQIQKKTFYFILVASSLHLLIWTVSHINRSLHQWFAFRTPQHFTHFKEIKKQRNKDTQWNLKGFAFSTGVNT